MKNSVTDASSNGTAGDAMIAAPVPPAAAMATADEATEGLLYAAVCELVRPAIWVALRCQICGYRGEFIDISTG